MRKVLLSVFTIGMVLLFSSALYSQVEDGSFLEEDIIFTDINGIEHSIYEYLDEEISVVLELFAEWSEPDWTYHNEESGHINAGQLNVLYDEYGPGGTNELMVFGIETYPSTLESDLYGGNGTNGWDWVTVVSYPIANANIGDVFNQTYYPYIIMICPNRQIYEVGTQSAAYIYNESTSCVSVFCDPPVVSYTFSQTGMDIMFSSNVSGGQTPYSFEWDFGDGTTSNEENPTHEYQSTGAYEVCLTVSGSDGCFASELCNVVTIEANEQPICLVTVDQENADHNVVVWEKNPGLVGVDSVFIYREITTFNYQKVGAVHGDSLSQFHDYNANPNEMGFRYKISVLYENGSESDLSIYHNTIHLQYLGNGNFNWSHYTVEGSNAVVASYNFYRDTNADGNWEEIAVVSGTQTSYTDINFDNHPNALYYVDVKWLGNDEEDVCVSTRAVSHNTSRSNVRGLNEQQECYSPSFMHLASIGNEYAQIGWSSIADSWNMKWGVTGFDFNTEGTTVATSNNPHFLPGLIEEETYDVYVQAVCDTEASDWTQVFTFTTGTVGVGVHAPYQVELYPNPTSGQVELVIENGQPGNYQVKLYDITGKLLQSQQTNSNRMTMDISNRAQGMYFIEVVQGEHVLRKKLMKQ